MSTIPRFCVLNAYRFIMYVCASFVTLDKFETNSVLQSTLSCLTSLFIVSYSGSKAPESMSAIPLSVLALTNVKVTPFWCLGRVLLFHTPRMRDVSLDKTLSKLCATQVSLSGKTEFILQMDPDSPISPRPPGFGERAFLLSLSLLFPLGVDVTRYMSPRCDVNLNVLSLFLGLLRSNCVHTIGLVQRFQTERQLRAGDSATAVSPSSSFKSFHAKRYYTRAFTPSSAWQSKSCACCSCCRRYAQGVSSSGYHSILAPHSALLSFCFSLLTFLLATRLPSPLFSWSVLSSSTHFALSACSISLVQVALRVSNSPLRVQQSKQNICLLVFLHMMFVTLLSNNANSIFLNVIADCREACAEWVDRIEKVRT